MILENVTRSSRGPAAALTGLSLLAATITTSTITAFTAKTAAATPAAAESGRDVRLPGTGVTLHERSGDRAWVSAFSVDRKNGSYARSGNRFIRKPGYWEFTVAPKGHRALGVPTNYVKGHDSVDIVNLASGKKVSITTVKAPFIAEYGLWSRDGRAVLLTVKKKVKKKWVPTGFVTVDVEAGRAHGVDLADLDKDTVFQWAPDGSVVADKGDDVVFYDTDGNQTSTFGGVGWTVGGEDVFSPSGKRLATWCPEKVSADICLWDAGSGDKVRQIYFAAEQVWGWWDDTHLIAVRKKGGGFQSVLIDLKGKVTRVLADISATAWKKDRVYLSYTHR